MTSWFTGRTRESRLWQATPQTVDSLGAELERQARQLADRPHAAVDLLTRWIEQSDDGQEAFVIDGSEESAKSGTAVLGPEGKASSAPQLSLSFREAFLKSRAFEVLLEACSRLPALGAVARSAALALQEDTTSQEITAMARTLTDAVDRWLLPGADALWPSLLQALVTGSENTDTSLTAKKGALQWVPWARKVFATVKRGWQAESLPRVLRQLDRRASELAAMKSKRAAMAHSVGASSSQLLTSGASLSKTGIRAALAREQLQQQSEEAADLRERVGLLCTACERLRDAELSGSGRAMKLERLLEDASEALKALDGQAKALCSEEDSLNSSISDIGGELQKQITSILLTQQEFTEKREVFTEERTALTRRLEEVNSQLSQIDKAAANCEAQVRQLKEQLKGTTQHYEEKIEQTLRLQKDVSHEKLRAVTYKQCAEHAMDVVRTEKIRFVSEVLVQTRRHTAELRRSLAAYLRQERVCVNSAIEILESGGGSTSEVSRSFDALSLLIETAWEGAHDLLRRSKQLLDSFPDGDGEQAVEVSRGYSTEIDDGTAEQLASGARDYFSKEAVRGRSCADCKTPGADWASVSHGIYLCTDCAGKHRGLGVHVSFVRSTTMDRWSWKQLRRMQLGGNDNFHAFIRKYPRLHEQLHGPAPAERDTLKVRYGSQAAAFYRRRLAAIADGREFDSPEPAPSEGCLLADVAAEVEVQASIDDSPENFDDEEKDGLASLEQEWVSFESIYQRYRSVLARD